MQIDAEEKRILEHHRNMKAIAEARLHTGHIIVSIAAQWAEYSNVTGYGLTYSQFCDGFRFNDRVEAKFHPFRKAIYEGVKRMYSVIDDISGEIGNSIITRRHGEA